MAESSWTAWCREPVETSILADAILARASSSNVTVMSLERAEGGRLEVDRHPAALRGAVERAWRVQGLVVVSVGASELRVRGPHGAAPTGVDIHLRSPSGDTTGEVDELRWLGQLGVNLGFVSSPRAVTVFLRGTPSSEPGGRRRDPVGEWSVWDGLTAASAEEWLLSEKVACLGWLPRRVVGRAGYPSVAASPPPRSSAPEIPSYLAEPAAGAPTREPEVSPDETAALDFSALRAALAAPAIPFAAAASAVVPAPRSAWAEEPRDQTTGDETMALPLGALVASGTGTAGVRVAFVPELSVDQYAALVVELEVKGPTSDVLRRYGIPTADALAALHAAQIRRNQADEALAARFEERRAHFLRFARKS